MYRFDFEEFESHIDLPHNTACTYACGLSFVDEKQKVKHITRVHTNDERAVIDVDKVAASTTDALSAIDNAFASLGDMDSAVSTVKLLN